MSSTSPSTSSTNVDPLIYLPILSSTRFNVNLDTEKIRGFAEENSNNPEILCRLVNALLVHHEKTLSHFGHKYRNRTAALTKDETQKIHEKWRRKPDQTNNPEKTVPLPSTYKEYGKIVKPTPEEMEKIAESWKRRTEITNRNQREKPHSLRVLSEIFESYKLWYTGDGGIADMQWKAEKHIQKKYKQEVRYAGVIMCDDGHIEEISQFSIPEWHQMHYITVDVKRRINGIEELEECDRKRGLLARKVKVDRLDVMAYYYVLSYNEEAEEEIKRFAEERQIKLRVTDLDMSKC